MNIVNYTLNSELIGSRNVGKQVKHFRINSRPSHNAKSTSRMTCNIGSLINSNHFTSKLPRVLKEQEFNLRETSINKIFTAQWLDDRRILMGTKCNKLVLLDSQTGRHSVQSPLKSHPNSRNIQNHCGIHSISINPSRTLVATGAENVNDLAVYSLPEMEPVMVGFNAHNYWIFDVIWLDDDHVVSGAGDNRLALWSINDTQVDYDDDDDDGEVAAPSKASFVNKKSVPNGARPVAKRRRQSGATSAQQSPRIGANVQSTSRIPVLVNNNNNNNNNSQPSQYAFQPSYDYFNFQFTSPFYVGNSSSSMSSSSSSLPSSSRFNSLFLRQHTSPSRVPASYVFNSPTTRSTTAGAAAAAAVAATSTTDSETTAGAAAITDDEDDSTSDEESLASASAATSMFSSALFSFDETRSSSDNFDPNMSDDQDTDDDDDQDPELNNRVNFNLTANDQNEEEEDDDDDDDDDEDYDDDENDQFVNYTRAYDNYLKRRRFNSMGKFKSSLMNNSSSRSSSSGYCSPSTTLNGYDYKFKMPSKIIKCKQSKRIRALAFNPKRNEIAAISMNAAFHYFDVRRFEQKYTKKLSPLKENVCLTINDDYTIYAVGSASHVQLLDANNARPLNEPILIKKDIGIRSLHFRNSILSIGTGMGTVLFYDVRASKFLPNDPNDMSDSNSLNSYFKLETTGGWILRNETYYETLPYATSADNTHAIYSHSYDPSGTKLLTVGGPLTISLYGHYAAIWH